MQKQQSDAVSAERQMLADAQQRGFGATLWTYVKLSGPGWLQSAITLGGGSLAGALFLGALGGVNMLWLQLVAIIMGVVMLSAISYVTLSTGERPFQAINTHINPALGWGWLIATSMANMIWCMPQFSLCYTSLDKNLAPGMIGDSDTWKLGVSAVILVAVSVVVALNAQRGLTAKIFDWLLKGLVGLVVVCFFGVVVYLSTQGILDWGHIFAGFIPDLGQWTRPTGQVATIVQQQPPNVQDFWSGHIVSQQRQRMIGAAATAVGINMTFLMPYSMLHRGWDKPFRGLARFDLSTGMAIPYVLVTTCVVIASAHAFHAKADPEFLSTNPAVFTTSSTFKGSKSVLAGRVSMLMGEEAYAALSDSERQQQIDALPDDQRTGAADVLAARAAQKMGQEQFEALSEQEQIAKMAALPEDEKRIAASLVQRNAAELSQTLAPLIGEKTANLVFGLGVFGMGFSTIIILMLINGFVFCEAVGKPDSTGPYIAGCLVAGVTGALWPVVWKGESQFWLAIVASNFGMMLLPIAYVTFFMMMNSTAILGKEKPKGLWMIVWNILMIISVAGAIAAASTAIYDRVMDKAKPLAGQVVLGMLVVFLLFVILGFFLKPKPKAA